MNKPTTNYWNKRLMDLKAALESNNFEVFVAGNKDEAYKIVIEDIMPPLNARTISWGGSMTFKATGLYKAARRKERTPQTGTPGRSVYHRNQCGY
jgi:L-lactate utilization protein LutB